MQWLPVIELDLTMQSTTPLGFAVLGCLLAGTIALYKAATMTDGLGVAGCVLGAVVAFGFVAYLYLGRR